MYVKEAVHNTFRNDKTFVDTGKYLWVNIVGCITLQLSVTCASYQSVYKREAGPRSPSGLQPPEPHNEGPLPPRSCPRLCPYLHFCGCRSPACAGCCWRQVEPWYSHWTKWPYFQILIYSFFSEDLDSCWLWADSGAGPPVLPLAMPPPQHAPGLEILFRALTSELRW